ncbi:MAG: hypothetical protein JST85_20905 [Acidobacteria bacterium]|nr:hypothetical protein [Acidobacteriota bacterium]
MALVKGESVQLYLEGLLIFTLDEEQKRLQVGILSVNDMHSLKVTTYRRDSSASWQKNSEEYISDDELRLYDIGQIRLNTQDGQIRSSPPSVDLQVEEFWMPFELIPDLEELIGRVVIDRDKVKPVLTVTGGEYFSVLKPDHVETKMPSARRVLSRGLITSLRLEKDQVHEARRTVTRPVKREDIDRLGLSIQNLDIKAYSLGMVIQLDAEEELVCFLGEENGDTRELFRVEYEEGVEAKVLIQNAVEDTHNDHHQVADDDDPASFFHFLHYYHALSDHEDDKEYLIANMEMLLDYLNQVPRGPVSTGGGNPLCPAVRLAEELPQAMRNSAG